MQGGAGLDEQRPKTQLDTKWGPFLDHEFNEDMIGKIGENVHVDCDTIYSCLSVKFFGYDHDRVSVVINRRYMLKYSDMN